VNLGVGVYQDKTGKVPLLKAVREAEARWLAREETKSYLPIDGVSAYNKQIQTLLFGADAPILKEGRAITVQTLGGTGGLRVGADSCTAFSRSPTYGSAVPAGRTIARSWRPPASR